MAAFAIPSLDDTHGFLIALFKAVFPTSDVSEESPNWLWLKTQAGGVTDNHAHIFAVQNDLLPDTAEGDMLRRWAKILGLTPKGATPARKSGALRVFGTPASNVPDASALNHASGLRFETDGAGVVAASGYVDVGIIAIDTGSATRLDAGQVLTFAATPPGLQESCELQLDMDEDGFDAETDGELRVRVLLRMGDPPLGGAQTDYVQWALEVTGISAAYCYSNRQGLGSVDLAALHTGSGSVRLLSGGEQAVLKTYVDERRPVAVTFRVLNVTTTAVDVEYTVLPDGAAEHEFYWDDATPVLVQAWTAGTRTLQLQGGARPATMKVGDTLIIKSPGGTGEEFVVEAFSGADAVVLEKVPGVAPSDGESVYAGGALVQPIRAAIQAYFDALGTANPDASRYGSWDGNVRPGAIDRVSREIDGVLDGTVIAPVAIVTAQDFASPNDANIELLIAGRILVRKAH